MASQPGADLYVLPEMWCTGFDVSPDQHTLEQSKMGYEWMLRKAEELNASIAGSLAWQTEESARSGRFVNTLFVMGGQMEAFSTMPSAISLATAEKTPIILLVASAW